MEKFHIRAPFGGLTVYHQALTVTGVDFVAQVEPTSKLNAIQKQLKQSFMEYLCGKSQFHEVTYQLQGTDFQKKVWRALLKIPFGQTVTYGELAKKLKTSARAIGGACRHNPVPLIIPCHRVVAQDAIGGFSGQRQGDKVNIKSWLIAHEKRQH